MEFSSWLQIILIIYYTYDAKYVVNASTVPSVVYTTSIVSNVLNYSQIIHSKSSPGKTSILVQETSILVQQTLTATSKTTSLKSIPALSSMTTSMTTLLSISYFTQQYVKTQEKHTVTYSSLAVPRNHTRTIVCIQCLVPSSSSVASVIRPTTKVNTKERDKPDNMMIIIVAVSCVSLLAIIIILILCVRNRKQESQRKNSGRKASVFNIFGKSNMLAQIELEENENYAPCDKAFFNDYFQTKESMKKQPDHNEDSSTIIYNHKNKEEEEEEEENRYASLNKGFVTDENNKECMDDSMIPVYNTVDEPVYKVLEECNVNEPEYKTLDCGVDEPVYKVLEKCNVDESEYKALECSVNEPVYKVLEPSVDCDAAEYQVLECDQYNEANAYANPFTENERDQRCYQSIGKKTKRNVSDSLPVIKITDDSENQPLTTTLIKNNFQALKQSNVQLRSASVPNMEHLKNNTIASGIHKSSDSAGGKYDTEDYVFM